MAYFSECNVPLLEIYPTPLSASPTETIATGSSAERSLRLLARLAEAGYALLLADLATHLALPKATAHRLCTQLLESGFIARDTKEREFVIGPALRKLALDTLNHDTVRGLRHKVLSNLVDLVGETCNLTTLDGVSVLYLDRVEAPWPWRLTLAVGEHVPLHCTASGKLLLAMMPAAQRQSLLSNLQLQRMTNNTLTTVPALQAECAAIAAVGHALDREEFIQGLIAIAVPVWDDHQCARATLAIHAPPTRLSMEQALSWLPALHEAARKMSKLL